jgi:AmmeMemoRadiSam system protein B
VLFKKFTITPIVISESCDYKKLAEVFKPLLNKNSILIISSDLSHYYPQDLAENIDTATIEKILELDNQKLKEQKYEACGMTAILTAIELAKTLNWKPQLLHYETSAASSGDTSRVVGYASLAFFERRNKE